MSMTITLKPALFRGDWDQARSQYSLLWFLEAMCRVNQSHIRQMRNLAKKGHKKPYPKLYKSGVHYERERGTEEWLDIPNILAGGSYPGVYPGPWDDCEGLACWRVAELRELPWHWRAQKIDRKTGKPYIAYIDPSFRPPRGATKVKGGIAAKPFAKFKRRDDGSYAYHALLLLPDGRLEDPSLTMGMTWEKEYHDRDMAKKYATGQLPVQIRYADQPESVVVDPESPTGFSARIERAKRRTGLAGPEDFEEPLRGAGDVTNETPEEMIASWSGIGEAPDEDPELDALLRDNVGQEDEEEIDEGSEIEAEVESLLRGDYMGGVDDEVGLRTGRLGRLGRIGQPNAAWANRYHNVNITQHSIPSFGPDVTSPFLTQRLIKKMQRRK